VDSEKTSFTYSAYLQDEWKALPTVTVNYGARFDVVNGYTMGSQLSPRINIRRCRAEDRIAEAGAA
jgi:outer membrane receptor for ferrienterochelin and colicin